MAVPEFYSGKILYPAIGVLLALSALFGLAILPRLGRAAGGRLVGEPAPEITVPVVANGDEGSRLSTRDLVGKAVVLDFWATWCGPCQVQAPILDRLARRYDKRGLVVVGINVDEPADVARQHALKKGLSYPIAIDPTQGAARSYGVDKLPSLVVIDRQGKVLTVLTGIVDEGALDEILGAAL